VFRQRPVVLVDCGGFVGRQDFTFDFSARRSNSVSIERAADSSPQPVATSLSMPCPSRYFAV
jgi:hypothetical protein